MKKFSRMKSIRILKWSIREDFLKATPLVFGLVLNILFFLHDYNLSPDSIYYSSGAYNLYHLGRLSGYDTDIFDQFPVGMPILLTPINFITPNVYIFFINTCSTFAILLCTQKLLKLFEFSVMSIAITQILFLMSHSFLSIYSVLWSEAIFNALSVYFFYILIEIYRNKRDDRRMLITGSIVLLFCVLFRTTGTIWIAIFGLVLFFLRIKISKIVFLVLISILPIVTQYLIQFRPNSLGIFGTRYSSTNTFEQILISIPRAFGDLVLPYVLGGGRLAVGLGIVIIFWILFSHLTFIWDKNLVPLLFALDLYILVIVLSEIFTQIDPIGTRFLSPIVPIFFVLANHQIRLSRGLPKKVSQIMAFWFYALSTLVLAGGAAQIYSIINSPKQDISNIQKLEIRMRSMPTQGSYPTFSTNPSQTFLEIRSLPILQFPLLNDYYTPPDRFKKNAQKLYNVANESGRIDVYCYFNNERCLMLFESVLKDYPVAKIRIFAPVYQIYFR